MRSFMLIRRLRLQNFKCFLDQSIDLQPLTLLAGINGMGKSSVIQALLLLRQTVLLNHSGKDQNELLLNGPLINLGHADDVLYENAIDDELGFRLEIEEKTGETGVLKFHFQKNKEKKFWGKLPGSTAKCSSLLGYADAAFAYLQAERLGPRTSLPQDADHVLNRVGNAGELSARILQESALLPCPGLCLRRPGENETMRGLLAQTEIWLSQIGHDPRIMVTEHRDMDLVNLEFSFVTKGIPTKYYRATNVGFGLSYALPVFVAVLSSSPGSLVLIENPEAHLHPKGQTVMGHFLAKAAACGIQMVIETHSDHLLNGVRLAVKNGILKPELTALNFFEPGQTESGSTVVKPQINKDGHLDYWPDNFFDEWEKNLLELL